MSIDLTRGIIASKMMPEDVLCESFIHPDGTVQTVVFLNGLPIPYETFSLLMCFRIAPKSTQMVVQKLGTPPSIHGGDLPLEHRAMLYALWMGATLDTHHQTNVNYGVGYAAYQAVSRLFDHLLGGKDINESYALFGQVMDRADESYRSSLVDPTPVSVVVESFDLNDHAFVANKLGHKGFERADNFGADECVL